MTPREVVEKWIAASNSGDRDEYLQMWATDAVMDGQKVDGAALALHWDALHTASPDVKVAITAGAEEGDRYNFEATFIGTHTGVLRGDGHVDPGSDIAPTGAKVQVEFAVCVRVEGDKIVVDNGYGLTYGLMPQLQGEPARR